VFYFQQLFQTALNGIDSANVTGAVLSIASVVLLLSFLYSAYQAFAAGGDVRLLAVSGIKYLILGLVFASYGTVFRDVNGMFDSVANFIYGSTGVGDVFSNWMSQLAQYWQSNGNTSLWNLVTGLASGVISLWLILGAFVIFPVCYLIFTIFYAMYGSVLYTMRDLEQCLGEDHHKISAWIANGWLHDRFQGTRRHNGNGNDIHRIREKDILRFLKNHPQEINLGKVDQVWFLDLVLLRGREVPEAKTSRTETPDENSVAA